MATDRQYLPWCAALALSCVRQHGDRLTIHLLQDGSIGPSDLRRFEEMVGRAGGRLHVPLVDSSPLRRLDPKPRFGGHAALLRLLLPQVLPDVSRILYLDVDTLVVRPLDVLWRTDLEGMPLAAVRNVVEPAMHDHVASLGLRQPAECFNSGVLLIDLALVRTEGSFERTIDVLAALPHAPWFDQDALNVVFADRWKSLHPQWNAMNSLWTWAEWASDVFGGEAIKDATTDPAILHFEGPALAKPWHFLCTHPWTSYYRGVVGETPWSNTPLVGRTASARLIRLVPSRWRFAAYSSLRRVAWRLAALRIDIMTRATRRAARDGVRSR